MKRKRISEVFVILGLMGCLTIPAYGEAWDFTWDTDCGGSLDCLFDSCWCAGDWSDANNWSGIGTPPPSSTKSALIEWSNYDTVCTGGNAEQWLQVNLGTDAASTLRVRASCCDLICCPSTCRGGDNLRIAFWGGTLTVHGAFQIHGFNGAVLVEIGGGGQVKTN